MGKEEGRKGAVRALGLLELEPDHVVVHHLPKREFFIDNLLVRIHFIIVMVRWTDHVVVHQLLKEGVLMDSDP